MIHNLDCIFNVRIGHRLVTDSYISYRHCALTFLDLHNVVTPLLQSEISLAHALHSYTLPLCRFRSESQQQRKWCLMAI